MTEKQLEFYERVQILAKKHDAMTNGYVTMMEPDGLIVAKPVRQSRRIPLRAVVLFLAAFIAFKGFLVASLGILTYEDRLARLQEGTIVERAGALVMQPDPVTMYVAHKIRRILP